MTVTSKGRNTRGVFKWNFLPRYPAQPALSLGLHTHGCIVQRMVATTCCKMRRQQLRQTGLQGQCQHQRHSCYNCQQLHRDQMPHSCCHQTRSKAVQVCAPLENPNASPNLCCVTNACSTTASSMTAAIQGLASCKKVLIGCEKLLNRWPNPLTVAAHSCSPFCTHQLHFPLPLVNATWKCFTNSDFLGNSSSVQAILTWHNKPLP